MRIRWFRVSPPILLALTGLVGVIQLLLFPVTSTAIPVQAVTETVFLLVVVVGLFSIPTARELTGLAADEADTVYPPVVLGLGLFAVRAVTDVLDEFLAHPPLFLSFFEDGAMVVGAGLLLVSLVRWTALRERNEQLLRDQRDALDRQNDRLAAFASVVSHDLRNPLNVAMARLELVRDDCESDHLDAVGEAHDRMEAIIDDVLTLARVGPDAVEPAVVSLRAVANRAWASVETETATLRVDFDDDVTVDADASYLQQLFENVFRNAIDHGGSDVDVRVGPTRNGFYVEDTGPGIPSDARERVFDPGYSTHEGGTGFGLHIVDELARVHGWSVAVTEGTDGGARFAFRTETSSTTDATHP